MTWAENLADQADAALDIEYGFGEIVTGPSLPDGEAVAIVDLPAVNVDSQDRGSKTGARLTLKRQSHLKIQLRTEDAASLKERDTVTVRGTQHLVANLLPDGTGRTNVVLMLPGNELGSNPEYNRWR